SAAGTAGVGAGPAAAVAVAGAAPLTYLVVGSLSTQLDELSPLLIGHTFIIFALSALLPTSREGYDNRRLFRAGFLIGLAALCYLPLGAFVVLGLFAVLIFAANSFRSALLLLCGFGSPHALVATVFSYVGALPNFAHMHLERGLNPSLASVDGLPPAVATRPGGLGTRAAISGSAGQRLHYPLPPAGARPTRAVALARRKYICAPARAGLYALAGQRPGTGARARPPALSHAPGRSALPRLATGAGRFWPPQRVRGRSAHCRQPRCAPPRVHH
nr:hypothetical protein [Tanacetum cinerariifolium]